MSYLDMAHDAGYRGDEARAYAEMLEYEDQQRYEEHMARQHAEAIAPFVDSSGHSLWGRCGHCDIRVDNFTEGHRVTAVVDRGKGVECVARGDITEADAAPLARIGYKNPPLPDGSNSEPF